MSTARLDSGTEGLPTALAPFDNPPRCVPTTCWLRTAWARRASALSAQVVEPAGQTFLYNNYNPLLIGMILERATGTPGADGRVGDQQVVPQEWVSNATAVDTTHDPAEEYQWFWWTLPDSDAYSAIGNHGQFIYVDPIAAVVVARFGRSYGSRDYLGWPALFDDIVDAAVDLVVPVATVGC